MRFLYLPFQTKRHFEMMKMQLAKRSIILVPWMFSHHFTLIECLWKRGKWPFLNPLQGRNPEKIAATFDYPLFNSWAALIHDVSEYKQSSKCNSANLQQSLWEVRTSGRQRQSSCRVFLWKRMACFIFMYTSFSLYVKPSEGKCDFISSQVSDSTSRSHTHTEAIFSVS